MFDKNKSVNTNAWSSNRLVRDTFSKKQQL